VKALKYCEDYDVGVKKCLKAHPEWADVVTFSQLQQRYKGRVTCDEDAKVHIQRDKALLTAVEEDSLVEWLIEMNRARGALTNPEIGEKVRDILKVRRVQNRRGGRKHVRFNTDNFFLGFYSRHADKLGRRSSRRWRRSARRGTVTTSWRSTSKADTVFEMSSSMLGSWARTARLATRGACST